MTPNKQPDPLQKEEVHDDEFSRIVSDALRKCPKDAPEGVEAGRWKHGYIQGAKAEYLRALQPVKQLVEGEISPLDIERAFVMGYFNRPDPPASLVDDIADGNLKEAWHRCKPFLEQLVARKLAEERNQGMRWVKSIERRPDRCGHYFCKVSTSFPDKTEKRICFLTNIGWEHRDLYSVIEWLEEIPNT